MVHYLNKQRANQLEIFPPPSVYQVYCLLIFVQQVYFTDKYQVSFTYRPSKDATITEHLFKGQTGKV